MVDRNFRFAVPIVVLTGLLFLTACSKKVSKVTPPVTPTPVAPTATLAAAPSVIEQGQGTTLTWQTTGASDITIAGLGTVPASGSRSVKPGSSQTYTLMARGAGGTAEASARVTVNPLTTRTVPTTTDNGGQQQVWNVKDVFFDFDAALIRANEVPVTQEDAHMLAQRPGVNVLIEGHCDDRGSEEYNLVLGEQRANAVRTALVQQGVDASRIKTVSYGKEKPFCIQEDEQCWQQNRRDHFVVQH